VPVGKEIAPVPFDVATSKLTDEIVPLAICAEVTAPLAIRLAVIEYATRSAA
jgi:hypothetical protein